MKAVNEEYASLRVTLEALVQTPSVIVVGAATEEDGTGTVACHLSKAFADAGYRTIVVDPYGGDLIKEELGLKVAAVSDLAAIPSSGVNGTIRNLSAVAVSQSAPQTSTSHLKMRGILDGLRSKYDVAIVNAGVIVSNPIGLQFGVASDGVILAFRFGRKPVAADQDVTASLRRIGAQVLGVVAVGAAEDRRPEPVVRSAEPAPVPVIVQPEIKVPAMPMASPAGEVAVSR